MEFEFCKLEIYLPESHLEAVQQALWSVDAGHIGRYDCCLSYSPVIGVWRPLAGTAPYLGGWVRYAMRQSSRWRLPAGQTAWRRPWRPSSGPTPMRSPSSTSSPFTAPDYEAEPVSPFCPNSASTGNPAGALSSYAGPSPRTRATNRATSAPGRS